MKQLKFKQAPAVFFFCCLCFVSWSQDIHLSQFYANDHLLNPGKVGDFEGDYRVSGNYRNQWRQFSADPYNTYILSFDKAFHYYSHEIDGGIMVANDEFSGSGTATTKIFFSAGYGYNYEGHTFRIGIQPGLVSRKTDVSKQTFPVQWDYPNGTFDKNIPNQENTIRMSENYFDLNIGVLWNKNFGKLEPEAGFAIDHINRPRDTYFDSFAERLRTRKVFHAGVDYRISGKFTLQPKWLWMWTTKANNMVLGANIQYKLQSKIISSVFAGAYYRHGLNRVFDSAIPVAGCRFKNIDLGFNYDVTVSSLNDYVKRNGTFEISLLYTAPSSKPKFTNVPCDRY